MKFIISRNVLFHNLSAISGVIGSNNSLPILDNFLFTIKDEKLYLMASDMDSTMTAVIDLDNVEGEGCVAVPSKLLLETLKLIPETPIVFAIEEEKNIFKFRAANGEYDAPCFNGDEFPRPNEIENPQSFEIPAMILHRAISKTLFATGTDELRPTMMGVFCELSEEGISFVSTDAHKLVRYTNSSIKNDEYVSFILPKKPLGHLKNILPGVTEDIHVTYSKKTNHICFSFSNFTLYSSLKEGKYPAYENVIPKENHNILTVSREEMIKSIRRVGIYSNQSTYQIRISLSEGSTNITAEDMDYSNKAEESITSEYTGEPMEIGFNAKFLREMLENIDTPEIRMEMSMPKRAALVFPAEETDDKETLLMLIMPVMLN
ncbi:MAG: DNA polymerase III subunit beta [Bacteroidales bacterium]|nr:DNA polymerase III subunit beta [Bacteroidales bacterium]